MPRPPAPPRPRRWLLDLILALFLGGLFLAESHPYPPHARPLAQATVCAGGVAMMLVWVVGERRSLEAEDAAAAERRRQAALRRTPPKNATQQHFLAVQQRLREAPPPGPPGDPAAPLAAAPAAPDRRG